MGKLLEPRDQERPIQSLRRHPDFREEARNRKQVVRNYSRYARKNRKQRQKQIQYDVQEH
jgi:hypothetical protein